MGIIPSRGFSWDVGPAMGSSAVVKLGLIELVEAIPKNLLCNTDKASCATSGSSYGTKSGRPGISYFSWLAARCDVLASVMVVLRAPATREDTAQRGQPEAPRRPLCCVETVWYTTQDGAKKFAARKSYS